MVLLTAVFSVIYYYCAVKAAYLNSQSFYKLQ